MVKIATIGDIHIGTQDTNFLYKQLKNIFFDYMDDFKPDLIVNLGDTTDHKILMNSSDAELLMDIGKMMKDAAKDVIVIHGTLSHDMIVYKSAYKHLLDNHFRIFYKAEKCYLNNLSLLILPEEYDLKDDYYDKFLEKDIMYDFVFGHGLFSHAGFYAKKMLNGNNKHAKVWDWKDFDKKVYGNVVFGHIHIGSEYKNIIYPSSFSRNSFGEEEPKGFYIFEYDDKKRKVVKKEFIENTLAPKYKDIFVKDLIGLNVEDLLKKLRYESENNFKIRIVIDEDIDETLKQNILAFIKNSDNTSLIKKYIKNKQSDVPKEVQEQYDLIDKELAEYKNKDFYEITKLYALKNFGVEYTNEEINSIINSK